MTTQDLIKVGVLAALSIGWALISRKIWRLEKGAHREDSIDPEKTRIDALSDGVFAVALTLLIVDLSASRNIDRFYNSGWSTFQPEFISFLYSAFVVAMFWIAHHNEMNLFKRPNRLFLWLNCAFLVCIVFIPFSASLLAKPFDSNDFWLSRLPVLIYAGNLLLAGLCLQLLWSCAAYRTKELLKAGVDASTVERTWWRNWLIPALSASVMIVSLLLPPEKGPWMVVLVPLIYVIFTLVVAGWINKHRSAA